MGLRTTFLLLTLLTISVLLGGIGFIHYDGQTSIKTDWQRSKDDLEKNLLLLNYISKYKAFSQVPIENPSSLDIIFSELESAKKEIQKSLKSEKLDLYPSDDLFTEMHKLNHILLDLNLKLNRGTIESVKRWENIEKYLSAEIIKRMKNGQEFLPGFKSTLSKWAEDIPFFEKVRNSLDVSYVRTYWKNHQS